MSFEDFYSIYPRRINKTLANKKYDAAIKRGITHEQLRNGAYEYQQWCERNNTSKEYIAHPATWLGQCRWENDYRADDRSLNPSGSADNTRTSQAGISVVAAVKAAQKGYQRLRQEDEYPQDNFWLPFAQGNE